MLQLLNLGKYFAAQTLFAELNWQILPGDKIGLIGKNGCGKTTLLKILSGKEIPDEGQIIKTTTVRVGYLEQELLNSNAILLPYVLSGAHSTQEIAAEIQAIETLLNTHPENATELVERHAELLEQFKAYDGQTLQKRAETILQGLGFLAHDLEQEVQTFSGGWRMRAHLARLLLANPDILLLDEPNNHLDLPSLNWLESFLSTYKGAWLVVSHDRYFLNRTVKKIAELTPHGFLEWPGTYDDFVNRREELQEQLKKQQLEHAKKVAEIEQFVDRFRAKATKAKQVQSRIKLLDKLEQSHQENLQPIAHLQIEQKKLRLQLPPPPRSGELVLELSNISKAYEEKRLFDKVKLLIQRNDRIALVGPNGAGKSTLLKIMASVVKQDSGQRALGHNVLPYYFAQHQLETLNPNETVLQTLWHLMPEKPETYVRGILGSFLFHEDSIQKKVKVLSGGEKSRVALAKMFVEPVNFLLLDEPTNHLDLQSKQVLEDALKNYAGTLVFVSHDRYFINSLATKVVHIENGAMTEYAGDYDYYLWKKNADPLVLEKQLRKENNEGALLYEQRKNQQKEVVKKQKDLLRLEKTIAEHEQRLIAIDALLSSEEVYTDLERATALTNERSGVEKSLERFYEDWFIMNHS